MCRLRYSGGMNINLNRVVAVLWWSAVMMTGCASHVVVPEALEAHRKAQCQPDLIGPDYVARMVLFLASDDARMCTANNYMVEAGSI